jgi:predicted permease
MIAGEWLRRIWYLVNRRRLDRELAEEMASHREMMDEAKHFGSVLRLREESRDAWVWRWLDEAAQDIKHAARTLVRTPGFSATTVLILAFGIGLNLAFFQLLNVTALRPPSVKSPETLMRFDFLGKNFRSNNVPYPVTQFIRHHNSVFSAVLTSAGGNITWEDGDNPEDRVPVLYVSANWFTELGYGAARGRTFMESLDERGDAPPAVIVSYDFWQARLRGERDAVGRTVRVNDRPATIIGIAPDRFPGLDLYGPKLWLLIHQIDHFNPGSDFKESWGAHSTQFYARLRDGVSPVAIRGALKPTVLELARMRPAEFSADQTFEPSSGSDGFRGPRDRRELMTVALLIGSLTLVVLMVTCANLGNLMLSHGIARLREFAVRSAIGASRWRILRQQVVESLVLAIAGGTGGLLLAHWCVTAFAASTLLPSYLDFAPDWRMMTAAMAIALFSALLFGLVPAWMISRRDLAAVMREGGHQASSGLSRARLRLVLVTSQVAGCCVLLIVAGLMVRSLQRLVMRDLGFEFEQVAVMDASPHQYGIRGEAARAYWDDVKRRVSAHPDVDLVALATQAPLGESVSQSFYKDAPGLSVSSTGIEPSFFALMRIPLIAGRAFQRDDDPAAVIIVSRRLAVTMYGTWDVLGKQFPKSGSSTRTIVGVSEDAPLLRPGATTVAEQYAPIDRDRFGDALMLVRSRRNPLSILAPMRAAARASDRRVLATTKLMRTSYEERVRTGRLTSLIAGTTGLLALALACLGIFGVIAHSVVLRTKEIGIRRALGAPGSSVVALLARQLAIPVGVGMLLGTGAGLAAGWMLAREPFYLPSADVTTPVIVLLFFAFTATVAAILPARRALGVEPIRALRRE